MKKYFYLGLLSVILMSVPAVQAQTSTPENTTASQTALQVTHVDNEQIPTLRNLRRRGKTVVFLGASAAALQNAPTDLQALKNWVGDGGVLAVYSDAATLFGFQLQTARQGTAQTGGQLFGRAVAALPFGSEPLLWPTSANSMSGMAPAVFSDPTAFGRMTVFYQMQLGDSLVVSHPSAVPLLRVTDLAEPQTTLLASAMASYGNGWVIFLPRQIEANRTQGNQFITNIMSMGANPPLPVDIGAIATTANSLSGNSPDYKTLLKHLQNRLAGKWQPATAETATSGVAALMPATLPVARPLAEAMINALQAADSPTAPARARKRANGEIALWLMQARLQRAGADSTTGSAAATEAASNWLNTASQNAPNSREVLFWKGVMQAQNADDTALPSSQRTAAFNNATSDWNAAGTATLLMAPLRTDTTTTNSALFGDISPAMLTLWAQQTRLAATVTASEPSVLGQSGNAAILLHASDDPTLRLVLPHVRKLPSLSTQFGWVAPDEEVLAFPNEAALDAYATHLNPLESGGASSLNSTFGGSGRIIGHHILIVSQQSAPLTLTATPSRTSIDTAILGRMHAEALMEALDEDGGKIPVWIQLGMMSLGSDAERGITKAPTPELLKAGAANQLLTANRFTAAMLSENTGMADNEALSLMTYFYLKFGAGAVMETIQRLASGQSIAVALNATTGMSEDTFFKSWYTALAGNNGGRRTVKPRPARRSTRGRARRPVITNRSIDRANITRF